MNGESVIMSNWKRIWNNRTPNENAIFSNDLEEKFMELKRLTGNDTVKNGGVEYRNFIKQFNRLKELIFLKNQSESFFEVGCGSGPYLMLLENEGFEIGGMDYSNILIDVASKVLINPNELYCDEARNLNTDIKYDTVFSTSAFEYFENLDYVKAVLDKMVDKARYSIAILDVHDDSCREAYIDYRRSVIEDYDKKYKGLEKLFIDKDFFIEYARVNELEVIFDESALDGYWNKPFVYDVYMYKNM